MHAGIILLSCSTLMVEIALTRIFSVMMWYHFSFFVISVALLGFGAGGALLCVLKNKFVKNFQKTIVFLALGFAALCIAALFVMGHVRIDPFQIVDQPFLILRLSFLCSVFILIFILSGIYFGVMMIEMPDKIGTIYFANMAGAGCGCLAVIPAMSFLSNSGVIVCAAAISVLAAFITGWKDSSRKVKIIIALLFFGLTALMFNAQSLFVFKIPESKGMSMLLQSGEEIIATKWNIFSQVDVINGGNCHYAPGISSKYKSALPDQKFIFIDADADTPITLNQGAKNSLDFLDYVPSSIAYQMKKQAKVCIIGAGGGFDVLSAFHSGNARHVTAVEINPLISGLVEHPFGEYSGHLYSSNNVTLRNEDGRNFIRNTVDQYDVIQMSLVDTWAAVSNSAYSLTENYLYTTEAFEDYIQHLNNDGILTVTRWFMDPPAELLKLVVMVNGSLVRMGIMHPEKNVVIVQSGRVAVLLIKKTEFKNSETDQLKMICEKRGFNIIYSYGLKTDNIFSYYYNLKNKTNFISDSPFNIRPATDDKPFYFQNTSWKHMTNSINVSIINRDQNKVSYIILLVVLAQSIFLSIVLIIGPLLLAKREGTSLTGSFKNGYMMFLYFALLGLAFMFVEVTLIQKFILFLGQPVYSFSIVLFSLLISAGIGGLMPARVQKNISMKKLGMILGILGILICGYVFVLQSMSSIILGWPLWIRCILTIILIMPLGFLMGMPFPMMLNYAGKYNPNLIPWCLGINGCFSVVSSVLCIIIAMEFGFSIVMLLAAFCYLAAFFIVHYYERAGVNFPG